VSAFRKIGRVVLVGAGPGDPDLLTLRAVRALREADVVLVDDLVDRRVLAHVRARARIVDVGKRGGCKSTPQAYIERLLVREARAGNTVVRLKGGDPFVFGRGGEEQEAAARGGVDCEVISGITAGVAAAQAAGVPLTHRACTQGAIFVTGHTADGAAPDWAALVATRMTLVVYMGVARVAQIESSLRGAGMAATTPVAIVERASCADERTTVTRLDALRRVVERDAIRSPAILIIGDVVARAEAFSLRRAPAAPRPLRATPLQASRAAR
jgi:uroporphyrin-III C-methyltransferase